MKKVKTTNRMPLKVGATITLSFILIAFMCVAAHFGMNTRSKADIKGDDVCTTTTMTSTGTTSTTSSTTTSTSTKTTTATTTQTTTTSTTTSTVETVLMTQPIVENQTIVVVTEPVYVEPVTESCDLSTSYNESDAILIAQVVNKEASASYDGKLAVASVIVNRSNYWGISISDVVYAPGQFSVVSYLGSYTDIDYQVAVQVLTCGSANNAYYFDGNHPDGLNHFRDINNNYIGAW